MLLWTKRKAGAWLKNLCLLLASTCVAFAVAELFATIWLLNFATQDQFRFYGTLEQNQKRFEKTGESASKYVPHRYVGYVPSPGYRRGLNYHNDLGYRGEAFTADKPENEYRVVCVGGSTTYTALVEAPSDAYPAVMERELNERGFDHVRVINAGAEGWSSWETLVNFQFRVLDLQPDMIIIYHGINDVNSRLVWPRRAYLGDNSGFALHFSGLNSSESFFERSTVVRMILVRMGKWSSPLTLRNVFGTGATRTSKFWVYASQIDNGTYPYGLFKKVPVERMLRLNSPVYFRRNLEILIVACKQNGVAPVLATIALNPTTADDVFNPPDIVKGIEEHNDIIRELGREFDVPVFEFAKAFPMDPDLFFDFCHVNKDGAAVKGRMFAEFLLREGLLQGVPTRTD